MKKQAFAKRLSSFVLTFFVATLAAMAQKQMEIVDFSKDPNDLRATKKDPNGNYCAMIIVETNLTDLKFSGSGGGVVGTATDPNYPGEVWVYVSEGATMLSINHQEYTPIRYTYPMAIEGRTVYRAKLKAEAVIGEIQNPLLIIHVEPRNAKLFIDNEEAEVKDGSATLSINRGRHLYRVEAEDYETTSGVVELADETVTRTVTLKPKFGYLDIFSLPEEGASVFVNGDSIGVTPIRQHRLPVDTYSIQLKKDFFYTVDSLATITSGATTSQTYSLVSTIEPEEGRRTLVLLEGAYHPSQISFGAMVGIVNNNGAYVRFRSDFGSASGDLETDDTGVITGTSETPYYTGTSKKAKMSITAGYLRRLAKPLYMYVGAGYGTRTLAWEIVGGDLVKNTDHSADGIAAEIGAIGRFGKFAVSAGYQTTGFKYHEASFGLGFFF